MITLFTTTKIFSGIFKIIQTNALNSWRTISSNIQIIIIGNSEGGKEAADLINAEFIPEVECSLAGTPLINSLFSKAESRARYSIMAYINADIILPPNFLETIFLFLKMKSKFLGVGYRWDMDIKDLINYPDIYDEGIDLLAKTHDGKIHSIQSKYGATSNSLTRGELTTFTDL